MIMDSEYLVADVSLNKTKKNMQMVLSVVSAFFCALFVNPFTHIQPYFQRRCCVKCKDKNSIQLFANLYQPIFNFFLKLFLNTYS